MKIKQTLKKILTLFCASIIIFSAAGCGNSTESGSSNSSNNASASSGASSSGGNASDSSWTWDFGGILCCCHTFDSQEKFLEFYSAFRMTNYAPVLSINANEYEEAKVGYSVTPLSGMATGNSEDIDWFNLPYDMKLMNAVIRSFIIVNYREEGLDPKRNGFYVTVDYYYDYTLQKINLNDLSIVECSVSRPEKVVEYNVLCGDLLIASFIARIREPDPVFLEQTKEWTIQNLIVLD